MSAPPQRCTPGWFDDDQGDIDYAINDFDEAVIGDCQLDVWRLATSLALVARRWDHAGFRADVRWIALDYADQVALDYASF